MTQNFLDFSDIRTGLKKMCCERVTECVRLRLKDLDFDYKTITVRDGKGEKDRITPMPDSLLAPLQRQLERVHLLHDEDLAAGFGRVYLPNALEKKYPNAAAELGWQYLFPAPNVHWILALRASCAVTT